MAEEKKDSKSKVIIIVLIAILVVILIAGTIIVVLLLQNNNNGEAGMNPIDTSSAAVTSSGGDNPLILDYDNSAVALNADELAKQYNDLQKKVDEGTVSLEFQNIAFSENGTDFTCHLANSDMNTEDMFFNIYKDGTFSEQIYLSGLLSPGQVIESFTSEIKFDPGEYEVVVLFTTVADDHKTMTSQTPVVIDLKVG
jgi:hypothetical protein